MNEDRNAPVLKVKDDAGPEIIGMIQLDDGAKLMKKLEPAKRTEPEK